MTGTTHLIPTATKLSEHQRLTVNFAASLDSITVSELLRRTVVQAAEERIQRHLSETAEVG